MTGHNTVPATTGFILTGLLRNAPSHHVPVILNHALESDFFGIEERAEAYPEFHCFNVWPVSEAAFVRLLDLIEQAGPYDIDTRHSAFGWIGRSRSLPRSILATAEEAARHRAALPQPDPALVAAHERRAQRFRYDFTAN